MRLVPSGEWTSELQAVVQRIEESLHRTELELPEGQVVYVLVSDDEIAQLNEQYSGKLEPTDVLTFRYNEDDNGKTITLNSTTDDNEGDGPELADVVISYDTAQRQADAADTSFAEEIALLVLHAALHTTGLDHDTPNGQEHMQQVQDDVMTAAGFAYRRFAWER